MEERVTAMERVHSEKIWLRGDGAITLEIIDGKFEVRFRAEIVAA